MVNRKARRATKVQPVIVWMTPLQLLTAKLCDGDGFTIPGFRTVAGQPDKLEPCPPGSETPLVARMIEPS